MQSPTTKHPLLALVLQIATKLKAYQAATSSKLLFALTTPFLCKAETDALVAKLNSEASAIMQARQIAMVDVYTAITQKCGKAPQPACFGASGCFCPHCPAGYEWLVNSTLAPAAREALKSS